MITLRKSQDRGHAQHGWLDSFHSFSFAEYYDPRHMGFGNLRVINEDRIVPGAGFGTHGHRDMEIISYVLSGAIAHADSMGNQGAIPAGDVQHMSAGTGVRHSEFNHSQSQPAHFLQIWIEPYGQGLAPGYSQKTFAAADKRGRLCRIAGPVDSVAADGALPIQADASLYAGLFDGAETFDGELPAGRKTYVHLVRGALRVNGLELKTGDAALIEREERLVLDQAQDAEVLVFDLAP